MKLNGEKILGGYGVISGGYVENTIDTSALPHSEVWIEVDYISLDSWDHASSPYGTLGQDEAYVDINGVNVWTKILTTTILELYLVKSVDGIDPIIL